MSENPLVSVLIPAHGKLPFLDETLISINKQTYRNLEVIIVDDRSQIDLEKSSHKIEFPYRIVKSTEPGIVAAMNTGLTLTKGKYIARIDADDLMVPERIALQVAVMEQEADLAVLGSQVWIIDEQGRKIRPSSYPIKEKELLRRLRFYNCMAHPSVLIRKELLDRVGGYREISKYAEDYDLWRRIQKLGRIRNLSDRLTHYRQHSLQSTRSHSATVQVSALAVALSWNEQRDLEPEEAATLLKEYLLGNKLLDQNSSNTVLALHLLHAQRKTISKITIYRCLSVVALHEPRLVLSILVGNLNRHLYKRKYRQG